MYLDSAAYAEKEKLATYSQAIRGYYSVEGNTMEIHFKGRKNFFVKAIIEDAFTSLSFDRVSLGSMAIDNSDGLQSRYEYFSKIFGGIAQPIFELRREDEMISDINFHLNLGVLSCDQMNLKLLSKRSEIIEKFGISNPTKYADRIISIKYNIDREVYLYHHLYNVD